MKNSPFRKCGPEFSKISRTPFRSSASPTSRACDININPHRIISYRSQEWLKEEGITLILVEQMARRALQVADYAYVMERGSIIIEGAPAELLKDEGMIAAYLG
ncbi:MAG: hypothetical protein WB930_05025 [Syntrophobacteraceae bacterium]